MKHPLVVVGFLACGYGKGFLHTSHSHPMSVFGFQGQLLQKALSDF